MAFVKATKHQSKLRLALAGTSGSGKTYTALSIAQHLAQPVAVIDTERGSASKYADLFSFDVLELESFHPQKYIDAIREAEKAGYGVLIIDSLSHAWMGKEGALELVDNAARRSQSGNSFTAWRDVTPLHNALVDAMITSKLHLIVTMRSKQAYSQEKDDKGKTVIRKVGLEPVQRDGMEYEFDVFANLDQDNTMIVSKTRCPALAGQMYQKAGKAVADALNAWLQGAPAPEKQQDFQVPPPSDPEPLPGPAARVITKGQLDVLMLSQRKCKVTDEDFKRHLQSEYNISSRLNIKQKDLSEVLEWLENQRIARMEREEQEVANA